MTRAEPEVRPARFAEKPRGHDVAAAPEGELLDDPAVGVGDQEHRERRRQRQPDREVGMRAQRLERFLGAVRRGGKTVRAQTDPGQERDERDLVEDTRVVKLALPAEEPPAQPARPSDRTVDFDHGRHGNRDRPQGRLRGLRGWGGTWRVVASVAAHWISFRVREGRGYKRGMLLRSEAPPQGTAGAGQAPPAGPLPAQSLAAGVLL